MLRKTYKILQVQMYNMWYFMSSKMTEMGLFQGVSPCFSLSNCIDKRFDISDLSYRTDKSLDKKKFQCPLQTNQTIDRFPQEPGVWHSKVVFVRSILPHVKCR